MDLAAAAEWVWHARGVGPGLARVVLSPFSLAFRGLASARGALYDAGLLTSHDVAVPAVSIGNLTVGGTGKTPVAAWVCAELVARGVRPALLMRGVGGDEAQVHALLNPEVPVVADPDRVRGAGRAAALGAEALVLDDAFQHRRARRDADLVLVSADRFEAGAVRALPAGPYREGLGALRRATVVVVTRKSATLERAGAAAQRLAAHVHGIRLAQVHLEPDGLKCWGSDANAEPIDSVHGSRTLAVAGVGDPNAFADQLRDAGADVQLARYPDHHAYTDADASELAQRASEMGAGGHSARVVTTLKDAVKLGPRWPRGASPLWYVSQRVTVERGAELLAATLDAVAAAARARAPLAP